MEEVEPGTLPGEMGFMVSDVSFCLLCCTGAATAGQDELLACPDLRRTAENDPIKFYQFAIPFLVSDARGVSNSLTRLIILGRKNGF